MPHLLPPFSCRLFFVWNLAIAAAVLAPLQSGRAADLTAFFTEKLGVIDTTVRTGQWDFYATGYAWHVPWAYSAETRSRLNERTWGGGVGRSITDADGDRHSVFVVGFADSHRDVQLIASYGWQRYAVAGRELKLGWGYMAFLFSRQDVANSRPLPALLPCGSIRWRRWEAVGLFVPRVTKDIKGDVFFIFLRTTQSNSRRRW